MHFKRLLNVAKSLREAAPKRKKDGKFSMEDYVNRCGTPACALGHYAARTDLQKTFKIRNSLYYNNEFYLSQPDDGGEEHFGIYADEHVELFGVDGCDNAKTPIQAARYIEGFVKRKQKAKR